MSHLRMLLAVIVGTIFTLVPSAHAANRPPADLGPIPTSGTDAANTVPDRNKRVIAGLACGSEAAFMDGARDEDPTKRPLEMLIAKAAVLTGVLNFDFACEATQVFAPEDWDASINHIIELKAGQSRPPTAPRIKTSAAQWSALKADIEKLNSELNGDGPPPAPSRQTDNANEIARVLNQLGEDTFGEVCDGMVAAVTPITRNKPEHQPGRVEYRVTYRLSGPCLERQINSLILAPDVSRNGKNPGTDKLRCVFFSEAPKGDWDMTVTPLTRLTFLLRKASAVRPLSIESQDTLSKLQSRLLTLSGGPAQETYSLWVCGNADNQHGSARDRLDDNKFYDEDLEETVEGDDDSFWDDLWGFLLFLVALLVIALAFLAIAALLAAVLGAVLANAAVIALGLFAAFFFLGAIFGGIEETENHLLMQNSAKYLKNKMLMEEALENGDADGVKEYQKFNDDIRKWFMKRLHRIAKEDFAEYNAKPYGRHSATALLNLHDFACAAGSRISADKCDDDDVRLTTALTEIFNLTSVKMALGSNQGRRIVPYRRLAHANTSYNIGKLRDDGSRDKPNRLFNLESDGDHWIAAMLLWTGQTFHGPEGHASGKSLEEMIWEATSTYIPPPLILDIALDKSMPYQQTYHHSGWERYSSGPGWLLTAGGTQTGYAQGYRTPLGTLYLPPIKDTDRGAGVPTTLMVSSGIRMKPCELDMNCDEGPLPPQRVIQRQRQDTYQDFIRFEGKIVRWSKDKNEEPMSFNGNFCVHGSFACGINMQVPEWLTPCLPPFVPSQNSHRTFLIIDSASITGSATTVCKEWDDGNPSNDFYVVVYRQPCRKNSDCSIGSNWGFIEIVGKARFPDAAALHQHILNTNADNFDTMGRSGGTETVTYNSVDNGVIRFDPSGSYVVEVNGAKQPHGDSPDWPRAEGDIVNKVGEARYTITDPRTKQQFDVGFSN